MGENKCKYCDYEAKSKAGLASHSRLKHKMPTAEEIRSAGTPLEVRDVESVGVIGRVKEPTLGDANYDPFRKFKTDEYNPATGKGKYYYRALNIRPHNLRMRQAQGFETIPGSEFGDLVLGRMDSALYDSLEKKREKKTRDMLTAPKQEFEQIAEKAGVKTFEEKPPDD